jgi:hypothetical protein
MGERTRFEPTTTWNDIQQPRSMRSLSDSSEGRGRWPSLDGQE